MKHLQRQHGAYNLYAVAALSGLFALAAMAALYSMRYERNLFAEGMAKISGLAASAPAILPAKPMRSCVINGKKVISNTDCDDGNATSKTIAIHDTKGFEAPKVPPKKEAAPTSNPVLDKIIEKQTQ